MIEVFGRGKYVLYDWSDATDESGKRTWTTMRTIDHRKERPISFSTSADPLAERARFNDEIHRLPTGGSTCIPKGVFRSKTHDEANRHRLDCLVEGAAWAARERCRWKSTAARQGSVTDACNRPVEFGCLPQAVNQTYRTVHDTRPLPRLRP